MSRSVVITGLGAISAAGLNVADFWNSLKAGRSAIKPLSPAVENVKIRFAAQLSDYNPEKHFSAEELTLLDRYAQMAVIAAREAASDAGLEIKDNPLESAAVIVGSGCCAKHTDEDTCVQLYEKHRKRVHPLTIPKGMPSAAASMVSFHLGIKGPSFVLSSACSSGSHAIIQGMTMIQSGMVDMALVGASDAPFTFGLLKSWDALRVVSDDTCRPFCKDRSGLILGEGAGMLVIESREHAEKRGAKMYAELAGCGMTSDAGHITRPDIDGISGAMNQALKMAGIDVSELAYINAHGTGTELNDLTETRAIHQVFAGHAKNIAISSTKAIHGHALGASSALELVATTMAMANDIIPPTVNYTTPDEQCDLDYVPNTARQQRIDTALSNSFAFGGLNAVIALKKLTQ